MQFVWTCHLSHGASTGGEKGETPWSYVNITVHLSVAFPGKTALSNRRPLIQSFETETGM